MHAHCYSAGTRREGEPANEKAFRRYVNPAFMGGYRRPKYNVPINILELETGFEVHVFASGFEKDNIELTVNEDVLYIKGKKEVKPEDEPKFSAQEFPIKNFERTLALNGKVDVSNISARHENGVLKITFPKLPEPQGQNISVQ